MSLGEHAIILALRQKNQEVFKRVFALNNKRIFRLVCSIVGCEQDAEELVQDVFLELYNSIDKFQGASSLSSWLYRVAVNRSYDLLRKRKRQKRSGEEFCYQASESTCMSVSTAADHPLKEMENKELASYLDQAIQSLPVQQRRAYLLCATEGLSYADIAKDLGTTVSAVESLLHRAKQGLRQRLNFYRREAA